MCIYIYKSIRLLCGYFFNCNSYPKYQGDYRYFFILLSVAFRFNEIFISNLTRFVHEISVTVQIVTILIL